MKEKIHRKAMVIIVWENTSSTEVTSAREKKILLLKRPPEKGDFWQPVTGHVEKNEDFPEGALREANEETGFTFSQPPHYLGIHFSFSGQWGQAEEKAYSLVAPKNPTKESHPPTPALDPSEHEAFEWFSPTEAIQRVPFPETKEAIFRATFTPSPFVLSCGGDWYQDGEKITHARTIDLLHQSLQVKNLGKKNESYIIHVAGVEVPVEVEDTPLFIKGLDLQNEKIHLLSGITTELDPRTIFVGNKNILYCNVNGLRAKFLRPAYYELTRRIEESPSSDGTMKYVLHWRGRHYEIRIPIESELKD